MRNERENILNSNSSADSGILSAENFNILGNDITAFYDGSHKLVFVLDSVINNTKPNVLLIINPVGDRKWDDILANDFGVNLESIRPKKDNKYQKLDIEYIGLSVYDDLINAFKSGNSLEDALEKLQGFRNSAAKRAAIERLDSANTIIENTNETVRKTNETLKDLKSRLKGFRAKLTEQRHQIGKEPTKQSAAKILRTEAQIDDTNAKIKRTEKRLKNAEKRLSLANEDAHTAKFLIERLKNAPEMDLNNFVVPELPKFAKVETVRKAAPVKMPEIEDDKEDSDDVKQEVITPLFEKDPNILDNNIAFKPIDFGNIKTSDVDITLPVVEKKTETIITVPEKVVENIQVKEEVIQEPEFKPLSFAPIDFGSGLSSDDVHITAPEQQPVEIKKPVDEPVSFNPTGLYNDEKANSDKENIILKPLEIPETPIVPGPEIKQLDFIKGPEIVNTQSPEKSVDIAIDNNLLRPVSPLVNGQNSIELTTSAHKPTVLYYLMLLMLIILSIFTLWMYQNSIGGNNVVPDLTVVAKQPEPMVNTDTPFINAEIANTESMQATEKQPDTTSVENQTVPNFE